MNNMTSNFFGYRFPHSIRDLLAKWFSSHVEDTVVGRRQAPLRQDKRRSSEAKAESLQNVTDFPGRRSGSFGSAPESANSDLVAPIRIDPVVSLVAAVRGRGFLSRLSSWIPRSWGAHRLISNPALEPSPSIVAGSHIAISPRIVAINGTRTPFVDFSQSSDRTETGLWEEHGNTRRRCNKEYLDL